MNILFLTTHFNTGGITSYILTLAKELRKKNHNVYVVTSGGNMVVKLSPLGIGHLTLDIRTKSELSPKIYGNLGKLIRFIREKNIDIIHTHTRVTHVAGAILKRLTKKPQVTTCHGFFKPRLSRKLFPCWGDAVIAISEAVSEHLTEDFRLNRKKVFLIPNGIDLSDFPLIDEATKKQKRQAFNLCDEPVIGIIARLSDVKGHSILISAMQDVVAEIPRAVLLVVGEGKLEESLKKTVSELKLTNNIRFYPLVDKTTEVLPLLDVFVMPSLQEGLGLSVMEAQAMAIAVIGSRVGGIPSLIDDGKTGLLVTPGDTKALSRAIIELLRNKNKAREMGLAARKFIEREFSSDKMVEKTLDCYKQVLAGKT